MCRERKTESIKKEGLSRRNNNETILRSRALEGLGKRKKEILAENCKLKSANPLLIWENSFN